MIELDVKYKTKKVSEENIKNSWHRVRQRFLKICKVYKIKNWTLTLKTPLQRLQTARKYLQNLLSDRRLVSRIFRDLSKSSNKKKIFNGQKIWTDTSSKDIWMALKSNMKRYPISLVNREMWSTTLCVRYYYISIRMSKTKRKIKLPIQILRSIRSSWNSHTVVARRSVKWYSHFAKHFSSF